MNLARRYPVTIYVISAFLITYVLGLAAYLGLSSLQAALGTEIDGLNDSVMRFGPSLAAVFVLSLVAGRSGVTELLSRLVRRPGPVWLLLAAVFLPPFIVVLSFVFRGYGGAAPDGGYAALLTSFAVNLAAIALVGAGIGEELGWRGYMLPRLAERHGVMLATFWVALAWLLWHGPAFLLADKGEADPFLPFAAIMLPLSMLLTWAYYRSGEGLLAPVLMHASLNASFYTLVDAYPALEAEADFQPGFDWTLAGLWWLAAIGLIFAVGPRLGARFSSGRQDSGQ